MQDAIDPFNKYAKARPIPLNCGANCRRSRRFAGADPLRSPADLDDAKEKKGTLRPAAPSLNLQNDKVTRAASLHDRPASDQRRN
jgi:hypothetical protein